MDGGVQLLDLDYTLDRIQSDRTNFHIRESYKHNGLIKRQIDCLLFIYIKHFFKI